MNELEEQIKVVAVARRNAEGAIAYKKTLHDEWETKHAEFLSSVASKSQVVAEAEAKLRELTLQAYTETGNKAPAKGVGIREVTKLEYDAVTAIGWALEHKIMLKLDVSTFEKYAKQNPIAFVTISQEPQATIATNLEVE
ncbi:hypothetical protein LCGC14_0527650 [marine sediment metagenome]|uniref:Uncharacterized protein n=1 Tax=marine sediment metagenome TaxID=412755 RepID=A0A0F9S1E0_9ZZZZ